MKINDEFLEDFELDANDHGEPHWFVDRRIAALKEMDDLQLADSQYFQDESQLFSIKAPHRIRSKKDLIDRNDIANTTVTQFGQTILKNELPDELEEQGVVLTDIFTALRVHPRLIQKSFMDKVISPDEDKMTAFHLACVNSGIFLYIPKEVKIMKPINIDLIQDDTKKGDLNTHVLIVAENDSAVTVNQRFTSFGEEHNRTNLFVEVLARANTQVDYSLNSQSNSDFTYLKSRAYLGRTAQANWHYNLNNSGNTWADLSNNLYGSDSKVNTQLNSRSTHNQIEEITTSTIEHGKNVANELSQDLSSDDDSILIFNGQEC